MASWERTVLLYFIQPTFAEALLAVIAVGCFVPAAVALSILSSVALRAPGLEFGGLIKVSTQDPPLVLIRAGAGFLTLAQGTAATISPIVMFIFYELTGALSDADDPYVGPGHVKALLTLAAGLSALLWITGFLLLWGRPRNDAIAAIVAVPVVAVAILDVFSVALDLSVVLGRRRADLAPLLVVPIAVCALGTIGAYSWLRHVPRASPAVAGPALTPGDR
jgi:hypothetical protein